MIIKFDKLELHNFLSIGHAEINLDGNGYVLVRGENRNAVDGAISNGSGKSSLWDGLCWCLVGQTMRGGSKDIRNLNPRDNDGAYVKLSFDIDSDKYVIIRAKNHSKYGSSVQLFINGEDCSGSGVRDGGKVLAERVPDITYQFLTSVVLLGQGLPGRFSNNTPSGRKEVIESLSKSEYMIEDIKNRIDNRKTALESMLKAEQEKKYRLEAEQTQILRQLESSRNSIENLGNPDDTRAKLESVTADIERYTVERQNLYNEHTDCTEKYNKERDSLQEKLNEITSKYTDLTNEAVAKKTETQTAISVISTKISYVESDIRKKKSITDICPTCGQKIAGIVIPNTEEDEAKLAGLKEEREKLNKTLNEHSEEFQRINAEKESKLTEERLANAGTMTSLLDRKGDLESRINAIDLTLRSLGIEENNCTVELSVYEKRKKELEETIERLTVRSKEIEEEVKTVDTDKYEELLAINKKFQTVAGRDFRGYLISGILEYISKKTMEYSMVLYNNPSVSIQIDKNNVNICYNNRLYEDLSGGEKQKVDIIVQLAIRDMMCKYVGMSTNIIVLDEIFDNLDSSGCDKILDLISNTLRDVSSTYVITHHSDINIPYDSIITVCKQSDGVSELL